MISPVDEVAIVANFLAAALLLRATLLSNKEKKMQLTDRDIDDINLIANWLALDQLSAQDEIHADLLILAGHAVLPNIEGAVALAKTSGLPLLISGGVGHATPLLAGAMAAHPLYRQIDTLGKSEAQMLAAIARTFADLPDDRLLLEGESRNCGENAAFSQRLLESRGIRPQQVILIQDPLLQRRTDATFRWQWRDRPVAPRFISWPVFVPQLTAEAGQLRITGAAPQGLWSLERFMSLLMGEVQRLRNDEQGYGPRGKGFLAEVTLPDEIEAAWQRLMRLAGVQQRIQGS
ncbi:YdcF family protein [Pantoea conspicua]|nr:YdcF family protein [Pantoea conspicua]